MADDLDPTESIATSEQATTPSPKESEEPDQAPVTREQIESENKAIADHLNQMHTYSSQREQFFQDQMAPYLKAFKEEAEKPVPDPPEPPNREPMSDQRKGNVSQAIMQVLKFGALLGIAYGSGGKGRWRGTLTRAALAGAIGGYTEGRDELRNHSLRVWEKNNELLAKDYQERNQHYRNILADKRLKLSTQADLIKQWSALWRDQRAADAAERKDMLEMDKHIAQRNRMLNDWQKQLRRDRPTLYESMGKSKVSTSYSMWVLEQSGGKYNPMTERDPNKISQMEQEYPWSKFLDYETQEEIKKKQEEEKAGVIKTPAPPKELAPKKDDPYNLGEVE